MSSEAFMVVYHHIHFFLTNHKMYIKLNSKNVRDLVNRWCLEFEEYNFDNIELDRLMRVVEKSISRKLELGFSVNYLKLLKQEFNIVLDER